MEETIVTLESCSYKALQADEEQGMPTWRVKGAYGDMAFEGEISVELDGREMNWEGAPSTEEICEVDGGFFTLLAHAVHDHPAWKDAREDHADYWPG